MTRHKGNTERDKLRRENERAVKEFLAKGKKIKVYPAGTSGVHKFRIRG